MPHPKPAPTPLGHATWVLDAACATPQHRHLFWNVNDRPAGKPNPTLTAAIIATCRVCSTCPVLAECRAYAEHAQEQLFGIWGGRDYGTSWRGPKTEPPPPSRWRPNPRSRASNCRRCGGWPAAILDGPDRLCETCAKEEL